VCGNAKSVEAAVVKPALHKDAVKPGSNGQDGWWYEITPLTFDRARIILTNGSSVDDGW